MVSLNIDLDVSLQDPEAGKSSLEMLDILFQQHLTSVPCRRD